MAEIPSGIDLDEVINSYPEEFKPEINRGLAALKGVQTNPETLLQVGLDIYKQRGLIDRTDLSRMLGTHPRNADGIGHLLTFTLGLANLREPAKQITDAVVRLGVVSKENSDLFETVLAHFKANARNVGTLIREVELGNELLPSLQQVSAVVDLRVKFADSSPTLAVPVAIMQFQTDMASQTLSCQASLETLRIVIKKLEKVVGYLERSRDLAAGLTVKSTDEQTAKNPDGL